MTTTTKVTRGVLVPVADQLFTLVERQALTGYLAGYSGLTRDAYTLDLRQYTAWCTANGPHLFQARHVHRRRLPRRRRPLKQPERRADHRLGAAISLDPSLYARGSVACSAHMD